MPSFSAEAGRKPMVPDEMMILCERGLETTRLKRAMKALHATLRIWSLTSFIGADWPMI